MGIAMFGINGLFAPLRSMVQWLLRPSRAARRGAGAEPAVSPVASRTGGNNKHTPHRPLRVVRVVEGSRSGPGAGRMFISGRMADVCAELERLAALEGAAG